MAHNRISNNIYHTVLSLATAILCIVMLADCASSRSHSSRRNSHRRHQSSSTTKSPAKSPVKSTPLPKADYDQMRRHVNRMTFGDTEVASIIGEAARWIGTPYRFGGTEPSGVDCSGFVMTVFNKAAGRSLPRNSSAQQAWCEPVDRASLRPGDLVFFATGTDRDRVTHVGLYIGNDEIIHASTSRGVVISQLKLPYFTQRYHSAGRPPFFNSVLTEPLVEPASEAAAPSEPYPVIDLDLIIDEKVDSIFLDLFN